jgi:hypothetical protein
MMTKYLSAIVVVFTTFLVGVNITSAHPGSTASDGCHYCRTNCDRWGEAYGERHCHNTPAPTPTYTAPKAAASVAPVAKAVTYTETEYKAIVENLKATQEALAKEKENSKMLSEVSNELEKVKAQSGVKAYEDLSGENEALKAQASDNSDSVLSFILGGGAVYFMNRYGRRKERAKEGKYLKGNITDDGEKVLYTPGDKYYSVVKVDSSKGEMWFKDAEEAKKAGWKKEV